MTRREFLRGAVGACVSAPIAGRVAAAAAAAEALPMKKLGDRGPLVSVFGLGGSSARTPLSNGPREAALELINRAIENGVRYFDTAATYGPSESYLGEALQGRRRSVVLASKTDARTRDAAWRELEQSLKRLRTDYLDIWQMHRVSLHDRDTKPAFARDGVMKAVEQAKDQKIIRHAGITGHHDPAVLAEWLRRYPFDTVLCSINCIDLHQKTSFIRTLLPAARARGAGVVAMKVPAYGRLINSAVGVSIREAVHYALSQQGVSACIIGCDTVAQLEENTAAVRSLKKALRAQEQKRILDATAGYWQGKNAGFYRSWL